MAVLCVMRHVNCTQDPLDAFQAPGNMDADVFSRRQVAWCNDIASDPCVHALHAGPLVPGKMLLSFKHRLSDGLNSLV